MGSTTLPVSIYTISTDVHCMPPGGCWLCVLHLIYYYLFLLMDGWLCRVDMVGVSFFFLRKSTVYPICVCQRHSIDSFLCTPRTLFSVSQLFDLPTALNLILSLLYPI